MTMTKKAYDHLMLALVLATCLAAGLSWWRGIL